MDETRRDANLNTLSDVEVCRILRQIREKTWNLLTEQMHELSANRGRKLRRPGSDHGAGRISRNSLR